MWQSSASARTRPNLDGPPQNRTGNPPLKSRLCNGQIWAASRLAPECLLAVPNVGPRGIAATGPGIQIYWFRGRAASWFRRSVWYLAS